MMLTSSVEGEKRKGNRIAGAPLPASDCKPYYSSREVDRVYHLHSSNTEESYMSLYTAAGKAKAARRTGHAGIPSGAGAQSLATRSDISDEQRQEIREAFDLFVRYEVDCLCSRWFTLN